jgi:hypothetical protein
MDRTAARMLASSLSMNPAKKPAMKLLYCETRADWRAWLENNYAAMQEIWLVYYKKGTGKASVAYEEAVQEALCFGWIDGMNRGLDAMRYLQRFTPRKPASSWSESNIARMKRLIAEGQMTPRASRHSRGMNRGRLCRIRRLCRRRWSGNSEKTPRPGKIFRLFRRVTGARRSDGLPARRKRRPRRNAWPN